MRVLTESDEIRFRIKIRKLKRELEKARRKAASEEQANKSLIDANTKLVDKDRLLMFEVNALKEEREKLAKRIGHALGYIECAYKIDINYVCKILNGKVDDKE